MSAILCARLRAIGLNKHFDDTGAYLGDVAATLIEQQAARIAELESEITRARSLSDTEIELLRRAEAAEAEVKRRGIALELIAQHHGQCITEPPRLACDDPRAAYQEGSNQAFNKLAKIALDALAPQEPRHD